jgi:hypothetical protein
MSSRMSKSADLAPVTTPDGTQAGRSAGTQASTPVPSADASRGSLPPKMPKEIGGPPGPEPTRYGDWQYKGRCTDF